MNYFIRLKTKLSLAWWPCLYSKHRSERGTGIQYHPNELETSLGYTRLYLKKQKLANENIELGKVAKRKVKIQLAKI